MDIKMEKKLFLISILSASFALMACGGSSNKSDSSSITGIWDGSKNIDQDGYDEIYIAFDNNGSMSAYDYAGDSYDNAGNCYWIEKDVAKAKLIGGNKYSLIPTDIGIDTPNVSATIDTTKTSMTITVTAPELEAPVTYKRTSRHISDFTPECDESVGYSQDSEKAQKASINFAKKTSIPKI